MVEVVVLRGCGDVVKPALEQVSALWNLYGDLEVRILQLRLCKEVLFQRRLCNGAVGSHRVGPDYVSHYAGRGCGLLLLCVVHLLEWKEGGVELKLQVYAYRGILFWKLVYDAPFKGKQQRRGEQRQKQVFYNSSHLAPPLFMLKA